MALLGGETQLKNVTLDVALLALNSRTPASTTITIDTAPTAGAESISVTASASTEVKAGNSLTFVTTTGRVQALVTADTTIATSATSVPVLPLRAAIADTSTAVYYTGMLPIYGIQEFSVQSQDQEVDTTNTLSGFGTEMALVRSGKTVSISGIQVPNDEGMDTIIKGVALTGALFGREVYAVLTLPDGERYRGAAKVRNFNAPGNQNEVKKYSFELTFMGVTFVNDPPVIYA
jgi:Phage tail tube protein